MSELTVHRNGNAAEPAQRGGRSRRTSVMYTPRFDICETDNELVLIGDLPGVEPENLDIRFEKQELRIHGKVAPRFAEGRYFTAEYGVGDFYRSFTVNEAIDAEQISAELSGGVLSVRLPKRPEARPRKIAVRAA